MSPKNLNVSKKTHNFLFNKLKDKRTLQIYKKFESELSIKNNFIVAVSGGPDYSNNYGRIGKGFYFLFKK